MLPEFLNKVSVIIPSLNPDEKLNNTINSLLKIGFTDIICINDGSSEDCLHFFPKPSDNITLLNHNVNKGKGAALKTAFAYISETRKDSLGAVSVDGDGQHAAADVLRCVKAMIDSKNIILGCRDFSGDNVPARSKFGNRVTSGVFKLLCGMKISDTQTGLRAFPAAYYKDMLEISGERFEYETNMLLEIKARNIPFSEIKIETVYIEDNKTSHFRPIKDSFKIYSLILKFTLGQFFKYMIGSVLSFAIDYPIFYLLLLMAEKFLNINFEIKDFSASLVTFVSFVIARIFSSLFNFVYNRKTVFTSDISLKKSFIRYYCLAIPVMIISATLTSLFENVSMFNSAILIVVLKLIVDTALFIINYFIQKKWVFCNTNSAKGN